MQETYPGTDNTVRQALVRTTTGKELKRPTVKMSLIDVEVKDGESIDERNNPKIPL